MAAPGRHAAGSLSGLVLAIRRARRRRQGVQEANTLGRLAVRHVFEGDGPAVKSGDGR